MSDTKNAVAAIRVSTLKQGVDGDSPDAQREQIDRYAEVRGINIKEYFVFLESGYKERQPMQEVIDYCKDPKNNIQKVIIKSIDRFTRGGSDFYGPLKRQLDECGVDLVDIFGIISQEKVNTLDYLGFSYKWSVYSPSKKSEILEAERAKDEMRDIMSRMIGAEIRYTRIGYWMRQQPYGYTSEKIETQNGKRCILKPHHNEGPLMTKLFELRAAGTMNDKQIAQELNRLGFKTRTEVIRDKNDRTKIVGERGGKPITPKMVSRYVQNPIYAGVIQEKWTNNQPIKAKFDGLVSVELFNKANRGKRTIVIDQDDTVTIYKKRPPEHLAHKNFNNPEFPYRKVVTCPTCKNKFIGSASRGKLGKYYPAYHCSKNGHYFRVPKATFEETIALFTKRAVIAPERLQEVIDAVMTVWEQRQQQVQNDATQLVSRRKELETEIKVIVDRMKLVSSPVAIKYMEDDLLKAEERLAALDDTKTENEAKRVDIPKLLTYVKYFAEHLEDLLLHHCNPLNRAAFFGVLFDTIPSYDLLLDGTQKVSQIPGVNEIFRLAHDDVPNMVTPAGVEPAIFRMRT